MTIMIEDLGSVDAIAVRVGDHVDVVLSIDLPNAARDTMSRRVCSLLQRTGRSEIAWLARG